MDSYTFNDVAEAIKIIINSDKLACSEFKKSFNFNGRTLINSISESLYFLRKIRNSLAHGDYITLKSKKKIMSFDSFYKAQTLKAPGITKHQIMDYNFLGFASIHSQFNDHRYKEFISEIYTNYSKLANSGQKIFLHKIFCLALIF